MGEFYIPETLGSTEQFTDPANAGDGLIQPNSHVGGNRNLKPEKSKQFSLGVAFSPTKTISGVILRYKHNLAFNWSNASWGATLVQNYCTGYRTGNNQVDDAPHYVGSFTTYDLQGQYTGLKNVKIALGVRNLFDKDPHLVISASNFFQYGYDPAIYDPRARVYYGRLTVSF